MIARAGSGWQTVLADLSLILFMVTASALPQARDNPAPPRASPEATPLALYRPAPGAPPLAEWLAAQNPDPRQQLSLVAKYVPGGQAEALAAMAAMAREAGPAGASARIVIEPGADGLSASLAYDAPMLARGLHEQPAQPSAQETDR